MPIFIKSKNNENIKYVCKLIRYSKTRNENRQFVTEGVRLCVDAVKSGISIEKTFYTDEVYKKSRTEIDKILNLSKESFLVEENIMKSISDTDTPQGIVCVCNFPNNLFEINKDLKRVLIMDQIQNPSNLGAMIRTCDALNFDGAIISADSCDIYNSKAIRSSMGSIFKTKILICRDIKEQINELKKMGLTILAMALDEDSKDIRKFGLYQKIALVLGNEGNGLKDEIKDICDFKTVIPINSCVDSLNVSVAAGVAMWEISRNTGGV